MLLRNFNIRYRQCYWDSSIYDQHYQDTSIYDLCYCEPFIWFVRLRCVQLWLLFADVSSVELPLGTLLHLDTLFKTLPHMMAIQMFCYVVCISWFGSPHFDQIEILPFILRHYQRKGITFRPPMAWPLSSKEIFLLHQCCKSISGSFMLFNCFTLISVRV